MKAKEVPVSKTLLALSVSMTIASTLGAPGPLPPCVASLVSSGTCGTSSATGPPLCITVSCPSDWSCTGPKLDLNCDAHATYIYCTKTVQTPVWVQTGPETKTLMCVGTGTQSLVGPFACHNNAEFVGSCLENP